MLQDYYWALWALFLFNFFLPDDFFFCFEQECGRPVCCFHKWKLTGKSWNHLLVALRLERRAFTCFNTCVLSHTHTHIDRHTRAHTLVLIRRCLVGGPSGPRPSAKVCHQPHPSERTLNRLRANRQTLLPEWFQTAMNISSPTSLCHPHDPVHWGKDYLFLSSFTVGWGRALTSCFYLIFFKRGDGGGGGGWEEACNAAVAAEILQRQTRAADIW